MISTKKNPNFPSWIQVFSFGKFVDEVEGRAKALEIANRLAKKNRQTHICHLGEVIQIGK